MKMTKLKKLLSFILCFVLIAAIALCTIGCNGKKEQPEISNHSDGSSSPLEASADNSVTSQSKPALLGEGATQFKFTVKDLDSKQTDFIIRTDKKYVGEALEDLKLIEGEEGQFGLYVKKVNGITADFEKNGKYWAFYENGKYAAKGADQTEINPDTTYSFIAE